MTTKKQASPTPSPAQQSGQDLVRINLNVSASTRKTWKEAALKADKTLSELIIDAMSKYSSK